MNRLSAKTLNQLHPAVQRFSYDRAKVVPGIVHLGAGAFHRAHQALFADDALERGESNYGITAVSLQSNTARNALQPQDGLYTVAFRNGAETTYRLVGSILNVLVAPENPGQVLAALADPRTWLVTLTITEKGYGIDPATGALNRNDPAIAADLLGTADPVSALGYLVRAIALRRKAGLPPFTLLPCDNLARNGHVLKGALTAFAAVQDADLAAYIDREVPVASSMVDRIVPASTEADLADIAAAIGLDDKAATICEPAFAWIIAGGFPDKKPSFDKSGALFVDEVEPFEQMKLRLLNGAHTAIAAIGRVAGFETVPQAVSDPRVAHFLSAYWAEALQAVSIDPKLAKTYQQALLPRFANTALPHKTAQIASDASQKVPQRLLAPIRELLDRGVMPEAMIFAVALWIRSCSGVDDAGQEFSIKDPALANWAGKPNQAGLSADACVDAFLGWRTVMGDWPAATPAFRQQLVDMLSQLKDRGVLNALQARFAGEGNNGAH